MTEQLRLAGPLQVDSFVDGPGIRMVLWTQGCPHHCPGCHNPQTHDPAGGTLYAVDELIAQIGAEPLQSGLTLSGGEPFEQSAALMPIARAARARAHSRQTPSRAASFAPVFSRWMLNCYFFNYRRLATGYQISFLKMMHADLHLFLREKFFSPPGGIFAGF